MKKEMIITDKNVILQAMENNILVNQNWTFKDIPVFGREQLMNFITIEVNQILRNKYFMEEVKKFLNDVSLVNLQKDDIKKLFKYVKFEEI